MQKQPIWQPGEYNKIILETTTISENKLYVNNEALKERLNKIKRISEPGMAYDLHILFRFIPGKEKTRWMEIYKMVAKQ